MFTPMALEWEFFGIFSNLNAFIVLFIGIGTALGAYSRKLSISAMGGILTYTYVVINIDLFIFNAMLYLILVIVLLWVSMHVIYGYIGDNQGVEA